MRPPRDVCTSPLEASFENLAVGQPHLPWPSALSQFEEPTKPSSGTMEAPLPGEEGDTRSNAGDPPCPG